MRDKMNPDNMSIGSQGIASTDLIMFFKMPLSRRTILRTGTGLLVAASGVGTFLELHRGTTFAKQNKGDNVVIQWNNAALQAIRDISPGPTIGSRALAIMHTCMYDAWSAYDSVAVPTRPNGIPRQKNKWKDITEAVSYAAYRALMDIFPADATLFTSLMNNLGYDPYDTTTDTSTPSGVGNVAAQAVISFRHTDGANQLNGYADTTGYVSVNTPTVLKDPSRWQPLLVNGNIQKFTTPHWGTITPFGLTAGSQFRPAGPVTDPTSSAYKAQADQLIGYSATLTDTMKAIADYWANGPHSETPPGHWELFCQFTSAQSVSRKNKHDINGDIKMFFALANGVFDAGIACWDAKRTYDSVRPITAVHYLYTGQTITGWGGIGKGPAPMDGGKWMPYQEANVITPPFPEYVSGHSTFSAAGAYIMQQTSGGDTFGDSFTVLADSSSIEPGYAPSANVTLSWPTFSAAAAEAGISRRYGGIHFQQGDYDGRTLGAQVASVAWTKAQAYITGTA